MSQPQNPAQNSAQKSAQKSAQSFSRPGAIDLSGLQQPAPAPAGGGGTSGAYVVTVTPENFQSVVERSMTAPVVLACFSLSRAPQSGQLVDDLQTLSNEFEGKFLLARLDIDAAPEIAQAMQVQAVPYVVLIAQGRPLPLLQDAAPLADLRAVLEQVFQQLAAGGFTGRHQPAAATQVDEETGEVALDPRYAPAQDALERGDVDAAVAEYQKLVDGNPADSEAAAGLAMAQLLQRTEGVDLQQARHAAAADPDDVDAQIMVADLDLLGGHVEDAFNRLIEVVRRTSDAPRDRARTHLIALFGAVGDDDPRVLSARRTLANALF